MYGSYLDRQKQCPLLSGLLAHARSNPTQFHIPGHKGGKGMDPQFRKLIGDKALAIDLINITPLDDLHNPTGIIREAQVLAAEAFGAEHTFFSVQGTSTAIMAMIMSVCKPGDKIIVPRNVHRSILSALIFSGAKPIFLHPEMDHKIGIAHGITTKAVETALIKHPDAKAVLVINPTYFGIAANLADIVEVAHRHGVPVLVDEAHGIHIHFHPDLPMSAMQAGADLAATSVHKLGGSLTQSSVLNHQGNLVNYRHVQSVLNMLTTTSTSYLLLASLDTARRQLALKGRKLISRALALAEKARQAINKIPGLYCVGPEILGSEATYDLDPTKLMIHVKELGLTGHDVEVWLRQNHNVEIELSDMYNILCVVSLGDDKKTIDKLISALKSLSDEFYPVRKETDPIRVTVPEIPELAVSPRQAFYADVETVPLRESVGRIVAELITVYPPGIAIVLPGEIMSEANLQYIIENMEAGLPVMGPQDRTLATLRVIKDVKGIE
ncbi:MAG: aminotransferase class I/II-fold pyridoxal phosphate-dependent enzyme [Firmicutes bacterium]|nr:aminotransferase class I/II-fold pyridoxal phosphate-dependent enzyme [Bacillota bacterium]